MAGPELLILRRNLQAARSTASRLERSLQVLDPVFPLGEAELAAADDELLTRLDALILRFTTLLATIQERLSKSIAMAEEQDVSRASNRDRVDLMEKLGAIPSAAVFSEAANLRNRLAHNYPSDPGRQAARLNELWALAPQLLEAMRSIDAFCAARGLV